MSRAPEQAKVTPAAARGETPAGSGAHAVNRLTPVGFVIGFGVVSLFADFTYEGARAVVGPYLATLGAGAALVGLITGAGEAVALVLRLASGPLADRTRRYWPLAIIGYLVQLPSVPALAATQALWQASICVIGERFGKAVRTPSRDTMLAQASVGIGRGRAFGLHETLDQSGALLGPLLVAAMVALSGYRLAFLVLSAPAALTLLALRWLRRAAPDPGAYGRAATELPASGEVSSDEAAAAVSAGLRWWHFSRRYWAYAGFTTLTMTGFATFGVLSYHLQVRHVVPDWEIPVIYALAMGVAAVASLACAHLYDRIGLRTLAVLPLLAASVPVLSFSMTAALVWVGAALWGAAIGLHESTMRAAVADLAPAARMGTAYGVFAALYGTGWLVGSTVIGALYAISVTWVVVFVCAAQALALAAFAVLARR